MSENVYPKDAPQTRRRGRRKPRPRHLPAWVPPTTVEPTFEGAAAAAKAVAVAPPPPSFGARGGNPALRFHALKKASAPIPDPPADPEPDEET